MGKKLEIETRVIGPQEAGRLLGTNANPRGKHPAGRIGAYARLMTEKQWKLSIILIDDTGKLVDGFGRLTAVLNTAIPQRFAVVMNWPSNDVDVIDGGKPRNPSALLRDYGVVNAGSARSLIAGLVRLPFSPHIQLLNPDYTPLYDLYRDGIDPVLPFHDHKPGCPPIAVLCGFSRAILAKAMTPERAAQGLTKLKELAFDVTDSPLRLVAKMMRETKARGQCGQDDRYLKTVNAIRTWLSGDTMKQLKAAEDWYPITLPW